MSKFTFVFLSEKLNAILETAVNTLDMSEFDESVFDTAVSASQLGVEAGSPPPYPGCQGASSPYSPLKEEGKVEVGKGGGTTWC